MSEKVKMTGPDKESVERLYKKALEHGRGEVAIHYLPGLELIREQYDQFRKEQSLYENKKLKKLPPYSDEIGDYLKELKGCIRRLSGANNKLIKAREQYNQLLKLINSGDLHEIKIEAKSKKKGQRGQILKLTNEYLLEALKILLSNVPVPVIIAKEPTKVNEKKLLSRLMQDADKYIAKLRKLGVTDEFIVSFIKSTPMSNLALDLELAEMAASIDKVIPTEAVPLLKKILLERTSSIEIPSVEAFRKSYLRTKPSRK